VARTNSHFGGVEVGTEFAISDLRCKGDESHLLHCPHTALRSCGIAEVAGVTCIKNEDSAITATSKTTTSPTIVDPSSSVETWSIWGPWSSCTKSCGRGKSKRQRLCSAGLGCSGDSIETRLCNRNSCPAEVKWSNWGPWTSCSKSCGGGRFSRQRSCAGGTACSGESVDERLCNSNTCSVTVTWSSWGSWSSCSKSCGGGRSERQRSCSGGSGCTGDGTETRLCSSNTCPAEVKWSNWGSWSSCSKICGGGKSNRERTCPGGVGCSGVMKAERLCNTNSCPAEVSWASWGSWTSCTKSCGSGRSDRYRACSGSKCPGDQSEAKWCNTNTCPDLATWSSWGPWSECTKTCGRGRSDRYRSCSGGSVCQGEGGEGQWCNTNTCPEVRKETLACRTERRQGKQVVAGALAGQVFLPALITAGLAAAGAAAGAAGLVGTGLAAEAAEAGTEENSEGIQQLCRSAGLVDRTGQCPGTRPCKAQDRRNPKRRKCCRTVQTQQGGPRCPQVC